MAEMFSIMNLFRMVAPNFIDLDMACSFVGKHMQLKQVQLDIDRLDDHKSQLKVSFFSL